MIVFKGLNQFWIRHDRQKSKMAVEEIRDAFLKSEDIISEIRDFLNKRQKEILEEIGDTPFHVIGTVPIMLKDEIIDITDDNIRDFLQRPPYQEGQDWNLIFSFIKPRPTLYGLNIEERNDKYVELFRNGYYEMRAPIIKEEEESPVINPWALVGYTVNYYRALRFLGNYLGFEGSYISFLSLYNIQKFGLREHAINDLAYVSVRSHTPSFYEKPHLKVSAKQIFSLDDPDKIAKELVDRIWQGFHYEKAPLFKDGKYCPSG